MLALPVDDRGRKDHQPGVFRKGERGVDHLGDRHRRELLFRMVRAVRIADARIQEAQVVVDLGDRAHGRARVVRRRLLLDRDRRRQAFDQIDVGLVHQLQELPRVRRKRLDIATLPFRVQRIECERALARAGQAGDHDQPMPRQVEVQVLQIVRARTADADGVRAGKLCFSQFGDRVVSSRLICHRARPGLAISWWPRALAQAETPNLLVYCVSVARPQSAFAFLSAGGRGNHQSTGEMHNGLGQ